MTTFWLERAYVDGRTVDALRVEITDGRFAAVEVDAEPGDANVAAP